MPAFGGARSGAVSLVAAACCRLERWPECTVSDFILSRALESSRNSAIADEIEHKRSRVEEQQQRSNDQLLEGEHVTAADVGEEKSQLGRQLSELKGQPTESQLVGGGTDLVASQNQDGVSHQEVVSVDITAQDTEAHTQTQFQSPVCPPSMSELSPTSVTQSMSSAPSPTLSKQKHSPPNINNGAMIEANRPTSNPLSVVLLPVKSPVSDGYNWRKYGQKQVKSPQGSRSYYKCTHSDCSAKKIECSDQNGYVAEIVNKGLHSHDPPWNSNTPRDRSTSSTGAVLGTEHSMKMLTNHDPAISSKDPAKETSIVPERKRPNSDGNSEMQAKEKHSSEPEPKRRMKKGNSESSGDLSKPGKKPKFVVHAAGDVGISGDGYRWRKYGQKMVKGNLHPRNYYRCTSAGCPVRKHIETNVDNTSAVIITYKGVHDHDPPVPKKRHGPPSAPLVTASAPASMNNTQQNNKTDSNPTQWSVGTEGELTGETATELGGEKVIESARTLLSIGFEIKPC